VGHDRLVVAPALIPKRSGERVKTNRRDAVTLARLHCAGELRGVWVPGAVHEAVRDLVRAREAAGDDLRRKRQQLLSFLLRHGRIYEGGGHWTLAHATPRLPLDRGKVAPKLSRLRWIQQQPRHGHGSAAVAVAARARCGDRPMTRHDEAQSTKKWYVKKITEAPDLLPRLSGPPMCAARALYWFTKVFAFDGGERKVKVLCVFLQRSLGRISTT
jgi:hypothetical protein